MLVSGDDGGGAGNDVRRFPANKTSEPVRYRRRISCCFRWFVRREGLQGHQPPLEAFLQPPLPPSEGSGRTEGLRGEEWAVVE